MDLYLQFGYGMMEHCRHLVRSWTGGTVILRPRDLKREQLVKLSEEIRALQGGQVLLDPQFYVPRSDHHRLTAHDYWPDSYQTNGFFGGPGMETMMSDVLQLNRDLGCAAFVLPIRGDERPGVRLYYLEGDLDLMGPSQTQWRHSQY